MLCIRSTRECAAKRAHTVPAIYKSISARDFVMLNIVVGDCEESRRSLAFAILIPDGFVLGATCELLSSWGDSQSRRHKSARDSLEFTPNVTSRFESSQKLSTFRKSNFTKLFLFYTIFFFTAKIL